MVVSMAARDQAVPKGYNAPPDRNLTNVSIQQLACCLQEAVRHVQKEMFCKSHSPPLPGSLFGVACGVAQISQRRSRRAPTVLELHQPCVVSIGTAQVKFLQPFVFGLLNRLPEQKVHGTQIMV